jgi:hypothetical protein
MANERARKLGYKFVTDDKYLVDPFSPTDGISYEGDGSPVSYANSMGGIMTQAPIPGPLKYIPEGDGGGRDPEGPAPDLGTVDANDYGYGTVGNMGMTEEEQADVDSINNAKMGKMGLAKTLGAFAFMGPFAGIFQAYRQNKKAKQDAIVAARSAQQQRDEAATADRARAANPGVYARADQLGFTDGKGGGFGSKSTGTNENFSNETGRGRTGYFYGGLASIL